MCTSEIIVIIDNFVGHKNWIDTYDVGIQLYWECTNSTLPSNVLESISLTLFNISLYVDMNIIVYTSNEIKEMFTNLKNK